jgi:hypothetical protein
MDDTQQSLEDFLASAGLTAFGTVKLSGVEAELPKLRSTLRRLDPVLTAAAFAELLTKPGLQSNCVRLEALVHLALALCEGRSQPTRPLVRQLFGWLGKGACGRAEDPAEDVFVSSVATERGNFRILEGIWESAGFYLQRLVNIVRAMPQGTGYDVLRGQIFALLKLSDLLCEREGLMRWMLGEASPHKVLPVEVLSAGCCQSNGNSSPVGRNEPKPNWL